MSPSVIPTAQVRVETEDTALDRLCFTYLLSVLGNRRQAGRLEGYLEAVYDANPGLADRALILPRGLVVTMPRFVIMTERPIVRLWD